MKWLTLVRHGKAESPGWAAGDFDRPLAAEGVREVRQVAARLARQGPPPPRILTSPAPRARTTAELIALAHGLPPETLTLRPALYLAGLATLLRLIADEGGEADALMLVGHNPGLSDLLRVLSRTHGGELATAAIVTLAFESEDWGDLADGQVAYSDEPDPT